MKQQLVEVQGKINKLTVIVTYFRIPLSVTDRTIREKTSKDTEDWNTFMNWLDLGDIDSE